MPDLADGAIALRNEVCDRRRDRLERRNVRNTVSAGDDLGYFAENGDLVTIDQECHVAAEDRNAAVLLLQSNDRSSSGRRLHMRVGNERVPLVAAVLRGEMFVRCANDVFAHLILGGTYGGFSRRKNLSEDVDFVIPRSTCQ